VARWQGIHAYIRPEHLKNGIFDQYGFYLQQNHNSIHDSYAQLSDECSCHPSARVCASLSAFSVASDLQTFFPPDSFYTFVVDPDAFIPKHIGNHPIPNSTVIGNQLDDRGSYLAFVAAFNRFIKVTVAVDL
jgi:hypothetical protein